MEYYIRKSAIAAEIKKRIKGLKDCHADTVAGYAGEISGLERLLSFIDTLEMKEVHWEKEFDYYTKDIMAYDILSTPFTHLYNCAKHFFELGMRVNNPITAADRGIVDEIIFALNALGEEKMISYDKEIEWLTKLKEL